MCQTLWMLHRRAIPAWQRALDTLRYSGRPCTEWGRPTNSRLRFNLAAAEAFPERRVVVKYSSTQCAVKHKHKHTPTPTATNLEAAGDGRRARRSASAGVGARRALTHTATGPLDPARARRRGLARRRAGCKGMQVMESGAAGVELVDCSRHGHTVKGCAVCMCTQTWDLPGDQRQGSWLIASAASSEVHLPMTLALPSGGRSS
jgi:hypothetical protein